MIYFILKYRLDWGGTLQGALLKMTSIWQMVFKTTFNWAFRKVVYWLDICYVAAQIKFTSLNICGL